MIKISICVFSLLLCAQFIAAQDPALAPAVPAPVEMIKIDVKESKERMSLGINNCLNVFIPEASKEDVERGLLKYMKNYQTKGDVKKSEYFYDNAQVKAFGNNLVDVYSIVEQKAGGVELSVFFDLGGSFLNSSDHPDKFKSAEEIVRKFARDEVVEAVGIQIAASQKMLDGKLREYDNLIRQDSALSKKIRDSQAIIKQAELDQQTSRLNQDAKKKELEIQQQEILGLKSKQAGVE